MLYPLPFFFHIHCDYIDPLWNFWPYSQKIKKEKKKPKTHNWMLKNACQLIRLFVVPFFLLLLQLSTTATTTMKTRCRAEYFSFYWTILFLCFCCYCCVVVSLAREMIAEDIQKAEKNCLRNYFIIDSFLKLQKSIFNLTFFI